MGSSVKLCSLITWNHGRDYIITCWLMQVPAGLQSKGSACWSKILPCLLVLTIMEVKMKSKIFFVSPRGTDNVVTFRLILVHVGILSCQVWLWECLWHWRQSHKYWSRYTKKKWVPSFFESQRPQSQRLSCFHNYTEIHNSEKTPYINSNCHKTC